MGLRFSKSFCQVFDALMIIAMGCWLAYNGALDVSTFASCFGHVLAMPQRRYGACRGRRRGIVEPILQASSSTASSTGFLRELSQC